MQVTVRGATQHPFGTTADAAPAPQRHSKQPLVAQLLSPQNKTRPMGQQSIQAAPGSSRGDNRTPALETSPQLQSAALN